VGLESDPVDSLENASPEHLTAREIEVLRLMANGRSHKQMAARLRISEHTVKFHVSSVLAKLGASSRTEAVSFWRLRSRRQFGDSVCAFAACCCKAEMSHQLQSRTVQDQ
jgi:DNA-binding NarL/FixJ family response regulator